MPALSNTATHNNPRVIEKGPSSLSPSDRLARSLGWFSIGLGLAELFAANKIAHALGMDGKQNLIRAYGIREIGAGVLTLSVDKQAGLASRIAGDALDIATLSAAMNPKNPKRENVGVALALVAGVTLLDIIATAGTASRHNSNKGAVRDYSNRSGFPNGIASSRGLAREPVDVPPALPEQPRAS